MNDQLWKQWLSTRPESVRVLALKYPIGTKFNLHGKTLHVMSYNENGTLALTATSPFEDYEKAVAERQPVCSCCMDKLDEMKV